MDRRRRLMLTSPALPMKGRPGCRGLRFIYRDRPGGLGARHAVDRFRPRRSRSVPDGTGTGAIGRTKPGGCT